MTDPVFCLSLDCGLEQHLIARHTGDSPLRIRTISDTNSARQLLPCEPVSTAFVDFRSEFRIEPIGADC